jgi:hypothetical protein
MHFRWANPRRLMRSKWNNRQRLMYDSRMYDSLPGWDMRAKLTCELVSWIIASNRVKKLVTVLHGLSKTITDSDTHLAPLIVFRALRQAGRFICFDHSPLQRCFATEIALRMYSTGRRAMPGMVQSVAHGSSPREGDTDLAGALSLLK